MSGSPLGRPVRASSRRAADLLLETLLEESLPAGGLPALGDDELLAALLLVPPPARRRRAGPLRLALLTAALVIGLAIAVPTARAAFALYTIRRNLRTMIVPPQPVVAATPLPPPTALPATAARSARPQRAFLSPTPLPTPTPVATPAPPPPGAAVTVLLIGSDLRLDEEGSSRADALMLARIDPARKRVALLSLTRDMMADVPGYGYMRINTAYVYGGAELTRQTVGNMLQIPIDYYVAVNFAGFITAVDALGGVTVEVDKEIYQPGWELHFLPGPNQMDGLTALRYARIRQPDSDYDRVKRQQAVLMAIAAKVREQGALQSLERIAALSGALHGYIETDIPEERLLGLAWALRDLPLEGIEHHSVEGYMVNTGVIPGDYYAQVPDPTWIETLRQALLGPDA